jgi:hypothetical protein
MSLDSIHLFYEYFKGLYITSEDVTPGLAGRMNRIPLSTLDISLSVYYKRDGNDTVANYWHYSAAYMASFTAVQHDYTTATHLLKVNAATLNDTSRTAALDSTLYIQGLFGVTPMIKLRKEDIQNWLASKNIDIGQIAISRVVLEFDVERFSGYELKRLATPLGLFYRTIQTFSSDENAQTYPHIAAVTELNSTLFGGALNTTLYKYPMKITSDFISIVKNINKGSNSAILYVSPYTQVSSTSYYGTTSYSYIENQGSLYQTLLKGPSSSQPPRLIITYAKPK